MRANCWLLSLLLDFNLECSQTALKLMRTRGTSLFCLPQLVMPSKLSDTNRLSKRMERNFKKHTLQVKRTAVASIKHQNYLE
jgi:hypothetical protein